MVRAPRADGTLVLLSLFFLVLLAVPFVLLVADLVRGGRRAAPPAPAYGDQITGRRAHR